MIDNLRRKLCRSSTLARSRMEQIFNSARSISSSKILEYRYYASDRTSFVRMYERKTLTRVVQFQTASWGTISTSLCELYKITSFPVYLIAQAISLRRRVLESFRCHLAPGRLIEQRRRNASGPRIMRNARTWRYLSHSVLTSLLIFTLIQSNADTCNQTEIHIGRDRNMILNRSQRMRNTL